MKRVIQLMVIICLILGINTITYASSEIKIDVNGSILQDAEAILKDGSTLLPVRSVGNALGGEVIWDNATKTASIDKEGTIVTITIGQQAIDVNGVKQQISTPAQIVSGRTYVLLKIAEIISWNIFQMDGIKYVIPMSCRHEIITEDIPPMFVMLGEKPSITKKECPGCKYNEPKLHNGKYVTIMDWSKGKKVKFVSLISESD